MAGAARAPGAEGGEWVPQGRAQKLLQEPPSLSHESTRSCSPHVGNGHKPQPQPTPHLWLSQLLPLSPLTTFLGPSLALGSAPNSRLQRPRGRRPRALSPLASAPCPDAPLPPRPLVCQPHRATAVPPQGRGPGLWCWHRAGQPLSLPRAGRQGGLLQTPLAGSWATRRTASISGPR